MMGRWQGGPYHLLMAGFRARSAGEIPPDFHGHNVGEARWAYPHELPLHSTDLRILTDAGVTDFPANEIRTALEQDGIVMNVYKGA